MLRTAICPVIREALAAPDTIEIMANPDGSVWIKKARLSVMDSEYMRDTRCLADKLDDPGFAAPLRAAFFENEAEGSGVMVWNGLQPG